MMCTLMEKKIIDIVEDTNNLHIVIYHNDFAICKNIVDCEFYFAYIDKGFNPLKLYTGTKEQVHNIFKSYVDTGRLFWQILKK